ncbi:MAG: hypothetical protein ACREI7_08595, partial [Myxococcota bacterium]
PRAGASVEAVAGWLGEHGTSLHSMGYRISGRLVLGEKTDTLLDWVKQGKAMRGAVLATAYRRLHPAENEEIPHAVGITVDRLDARGPGEADDLIMVDPWPGPKNVARDRGRVPPELADAHRATKYAAMILYWAGWS